MFIMKANINDIMPDYEHGMVEAANFIQKYFGIKENHNSLKEFDDTLNANKSKNVVLCDKLEKK